MSRLFKFFIGIFLLHYSFNCMAQCSPFEINNLKKIAIVFGEAKYKYVGELNNTLHDADDISDSLRTIGFEVLTYKNDDFSSMNNHIDDWFKKIQTYDVALFYYSGHGAEIEGQNYLFPIDSHPRNISDLSTSAINITQVVKRLDDVKNRYNIVILDACRSNPFKSFSREFGKEGLASMTGNGTFIGFAAAPGKVAADGANRNGTYTEAILKFITEPNLPIDQIFTRVNSYVRKATSDSQVPWKSSSFSTDYCFNVNLPINALDSKHFNISTKRGSEICISQDQDYVLAINKTTNTILVKKSKSSASIRSISFPNLIPKEILLIGHRALVIDSTNKTLSEIDWVKNLVLNKITLTANPVGMVLANNNQTLYVGCTSFGNGNIAMVNVENFKIRKIINTTSPVKGVNISEDGKKIYVLSKYGNRATEFILIDPVTGKASLRVKPSIPIGASAISRDDKLYIFNADLNDVTIYALPNLTLINRIPNIYSCQNINFSYDGNYCYVTSGTKLLYITIKDFKIKNTQEVSSPAGGITSNDDIIFVNLPLEGRILEYDIHHPQTDTFKEFKVDSANEFALLVKTTLKSQKNIARLNQANKTAALTAKVDSVLTKLQGEIPGHWIYSFGVPGKYSREGFGVSNAMYSKELGISLEWQTKTRISQDTIMVVCRSESGDIKKEDIFKITDSGLDSLKSSMKQRWVDILTQIIKKKY